MKLRTFLGQLLYDVFLVSFSVYVVSFFFEALKKGVVVNFVNLQVVLGVALASGVLSFVVTPERKESARVWPFYLGLLAFSLMVAFYLYPFVAVKGLWGYGIAGGAGVLTFLLGSILVYDEGRAIEL